LTLALSLLFATASSVLADGHEGTLPASGGTITFDSGVSVKAPDGASRSDVTVTYAALAEDAVPGDAPEGTMLGSMIFTLDAGGATFSQFVEVTIPFTADDLAAGGGRADNVGVSSWDAVSGSWIELYPIRDIINNTLTISQQSLGTYAIVVTPPSEDAPPVPTPTPAATAEATPEATPPPTGGIGVSNGMMMGLALLGMLFLVGGGYVVVRNRVR
jgi:hypothetical protein